MANIASSIKRARQNNERNAFNRSYRSRFRTAIKQLLKSLQEPSKSNKMAKRATSDEVRSFHKHALVMIDKTASKGLIHKNRAARTKSRLNARVKLALSEAVSQA